MKRLTTLVSLILILMGSGAAWAHAHLVSAVPAQKSAVAAAPARLKLNFSEAVHTRMSTFKVYPLPLTATPTDTNAAAAALFKAKLMTRGDGAARADAGVATTAPSSSAIALQLKPHLQPGVYVVMWKVMAADDGHITQGYYPLTVTGGGKTAHVYACPMNPEVMATKGGGKCPKCGMKLVPRK